MNSKSKSVHGMRERLPILVKKRNLKMTRSAHAYVRGNTAKFYAWLESASGTQLPEGPPIWICGDCHVGNLGPLANATGHVDIDIRDLDQTVIGNPAHDLVRLGLSLASAARSSNLPGITTAQMLEQMMEGYTSVVASQLVIPLGDVSTPPLVRKVMRQALNRKWRDLAHQHIEDTSPTIPLGKRFWPVTPAETKDIHKLFDQPEIQRLVSSLHSRDSKDGVEVVDAAFWVKGCSSLGRRRYAVLLKVGGKNGELCLFDIKEAVKADAPNDLKVAMPVGNAQRVVTGARHLSPALGERMFAGSIQEREVFVRELLPQDLKFEDARLSPVEAVKLARYLACVVGRAHARQLDQPARAAWQRELLRNRSKTLNAPSWLWSAVVELMVSHEAAYLEHCRQFASEAALEN